MLNIISKQCLCVCVREKGQRGQERGRKSVRRIWQRTQTLHSLIYVLFSPQLGQAVSNNCEHLGSLQALHPGPWGSSPGRGGPPKLPFVLKSCLEQADYHSSPRRDMRPGILSNSFTLIISTEWQYSANTDTYRQFEKVNLPKVRVQNKSNLYYLYIHFFLCVPLQEDMMWQILNTQSVIMQAHTNIHTYCEYLLSNAFTCLSPCHHLPVACEELTTIKNEVCVFVGFNNKRQ